MGPGHGGRLQQEDLQTDGNRARDDQSPPERVHPPQAAGLAVIKAQTALRGGKESVKHCMGLVGNLFKGKEDILLEPRPPSGA